MEVKKGRRRRGVFLLVPVVSTDTLILSANGNRRTVTIFNGTGVNLWVRFDGQPSNSNEVLIPTAAPFYTFNEEDHGTIVQNEIRGHLGAAGPITIAVIYTED